MKSKLVCALLPALVAVAAPARAAVDFTRPVPSLAEALGAARDAGKPLVVEFSASWCPPCALLEKTLKAPATQAARQGIFLIVYDGSADSVGNALMDKLGATTFPTLIAFDAKGQEVRRLRGYSSPEETSEWLQEVPLWTMPLDELRQAADAALGSGLLQLAAAERLATSSEARQLAEARRYFSRAETAGPRALSARAAWRGSWLDASVHGSTAGAQSAMRVARVYPETDDGEQAMRYLAGQPHPPIALLNAALDRRLAALRDAEAINSLAYVALKAGAALAARHIASRLRPLSADSPPLLDTLAELRYSEGRTAEAVAIERRALALGGDSYGGIYKRHLARFRRGGKEQPDDITNYEAPELGERRGRAQP